MERSGRVLLTLAEVAARLKLTEKAVRRRLERGSLSDLRVVRVGRSVRVDSEDLECWIGRKGEIGGARERATRSMRISAPPYTYDPTRRHVSICLEDPRTLKPLRKRLVTPTACDEDSAIVWGRQQALNILEGLMRGESKAPTTDRTRAKPRDITTHDNPVPAENPASITVGELWDLYEVEHFARLRVGSHRADSARWRNKIRPMLGATSVNAISSEDVTRLRKSMLRNDARYANRVLGVLRRMLEWGVKNKHLTTFPEIRSERVAKKPALPIPDEADLESLLDAAEKMNRAGRYEGTDLVLLILLGVDAALRPGEVAGLRWCDVELRRQDARIIVRNTRSRSGVSDQPPKAGDAGTVYLTDRLRARLALHQRRTSGRGKAYVFVSPDGDPLFTVTVSKRVADVHEYAGLEIKRGHWMRHCAASRLINEGGTLEDAKEHLRHSDIGVTQRYVHSVIGHDPGPKAAKVLNQRIATARRIAPTRPARPRRSAGKNLAKTDKRASIRR